MPNFASRADANAYVLTLGVAGVDVFADDGPVGVVTPAHEPRLYDVCRAFANATTFASKPIGPDAWFAVELEYGDAIFNLAELETQARAIGADQFAALLAAIDTEYEQYIDADDDANERMARDTGVPESTPLFDFTSMMGEHYFGD